MGIIDAGDMFSQQLELFSDEETSDSNALTPAEKGSLENIYKNCKSPADLLDSIAVKMAKAVDDLEGIDMGDEGYTDEDSNYRFTFLQADTKSKIIAKRVTALKTLADMTNDKKKIESDVNYSLEIMAEKLILTFLKELNKAMIDVGIDDNSNQATFRHLRDKFSSWDAVKAALEKNDKEDKAA